jgi:hypothetical protein
LDPGISLYLKKFDFVDSKDKERQVKQYFQGIKGLSMLSAKVEMRDKQPLFLLPHKMDRNNIL